jgi:Tat protein secretion system quality control protein TatD with DNase activity
LPASKIHEREETMMFAFCTITVRFQVDMACDLGKPLFVHEKEAQDDLIAILDEYGTRLPPVVIHSFTGSVEQGMKYIEKGFYIGITGMYFIQSTSKL